MRVPITEKQREQRRKSIGSSDAPAILGKSPFSNPGQIYWSKVANQADRTADHMAVGNFLERPLLDWAKEQTGINFKANQYRKSRDGPFHSNYDGLAPRSGAECKYANAERSGLFGEQGTDQVPIEIIIQCQHQMMVCALDRVWVAVAMAGYSLTFAMYCVERDDAIIKAMLPLLWKFWTEHVARRVPPTGWDIPPIEVLKCRDRMPDKTAPIDEQLFIDWHKANGDLKAITAEEKLRKRQLINAIGDAEAGECLFGSFSYLKQTKTSVDAAALKRDGLYSKYAKKSEPFPVFRSKITQPQLEQKGTERAQLEEERIAAGDTGADRRLSASSA